jgi:hypothetical protein
VALGFHGLARATGDVDLFIRPEAENIERLQAALRTVFADPSIGPHGGRGTASHHPPVARLSQNGAVSESRYRGATGLGDGSLR